MKKYEVKKNGYINRDTGEWHLVETEELPELELPSFDKPSKDEELSDFDFKWFVYA